MMRGIEQARKLIQPLKQRVEFVLLRTPAPAIPLWEHDLLLDQAAIGRIKAYDEHMRQKMEEDRQMRAKEPKIPTHFEMDGKMVTWLEAWDITVEKHLRLEREAIARGEVYIPPMPAFGTGKTEEPLTPEKRRLRDLRTVREIDYQTAKEAHDTQFDEMARIIDTKLWNDKPRTTPNIAITPLRHLHISVKKDDGTIINNSRYGVTLAYTPDSINQLRADLGFSAYNLPHTETLSFGIGYVTDRSQIVEAAQGAVSDEDLARGVKAYFVQSSYTAIENGRIVHMTEFAAVPLAYKDNVKTFFDLIISGAERISPEKVIPQAEQRVASSRRTGHYAAAA